MDYLCDFVNGLNRSDSQSLTSVAANTRSVSAVGLTNPATVTFSATIPATWADGDILYFASVAGATWLNTNYYSIVVLSTTQVELYDLDGAPIDATALAAWTSGGTGIRYSITRTNPVRIHADANNYELGQEFFINGAAGIANLNGTYQEVSVIRGVNCFEMTSAIDGSAFSFYTSGGTLERQWLQVTAATNANPCVITAKNHLFTNGQKVFFPEAITGMTELGQKTFTVANATANTFELSGVDSTAWGTFSGNAKLSWIRKETWGIATSNSVYGDAKVNDVIKVLACGAIDQLTAANCTWTYGSATIATSASLVASIDVNDVVMRSATDLNGAGPSGAYSVASRSAATVVLRSLYGGTTGTDTASIYRVRPLAVGVSGRSIFEPQFQGAGFTSGGWVISDNTIPAQTGFTIVKHAFGSANSAQAGWLGTTSHSFSHLNIYDCYRCFWVNTAGTTASYFSGGNAAIYALDVTGNNATLDTYFVTPNVNGNQPTTYFIGSDGHTHSNGYTTGGSTSPSAVGLAGNKVGAVYDLTGLTVLPSFYGISPAAINQRWINVTVKGTVSVGFSFAGAANNCYLENPTFENCSNIAINIGTLVSAGYIKNPTFTGTKPTWGAYITQSNGVIFEDGSFDGCGRGVYADQFSGACYFKNVAFGTPGTWGLDKDNRGTTFYVESCTIAESARYKAFNPVTGATLFNHPQYSIIDSFFGTTGLFFGNIHQTRVSANPPYHVFQFDSATNSSWMDYPVISVNVKRGESFEIDFEIANLSSTTFVGTIETVIRLNGKVVTSGITGDGDITSLSLFDTWDAKTITVSGGSIPVDGELTMGYKFSANSTSVPIAVRINP
jgi:hypothetical protein